MLPGTTIASKCLFYVAPFFFQLDWDGFRYAFGLPVGVILSSPGLIRGLHQIGKLSNADGDVRVTLR